MERRPERLYPRVPRHLPVRSNIVKRLEKIYSQTSASYSGLQSRPGLLFAMKFQPPAQQPWLITLKSPDDPALRARRAATPTNSIPRARPPLTSPSLPWTANAWPFRCLKTAPRTERFSSTTPPPASRCPTKSRASQGATAGGSAAWNADGTGVYYTRYPAAGERPDADLDFFQQVYFHRLGTPVAQDQLELGEGLPRIAEIALQSREDGRYVLATVANGDGGEFALYLLGPDGQWRQLTTFSDQIKHGEFGKDNCLYLLSTNDAPHGKILRLSLGRSLPNLAKS